MHCVGSSVRVSQTVVEDFVCPSDRRRVNQVSVEAGSEQKPVCLQSFPFRDEFRAASVRKDAVSELLWRKYLRWRLEALVWGLVSYFWFIAAADGKNTEFINFSFWIAVIIKFFAQHVKRFVWFLRLVLSLTTRLWTYAF